MSLFNPGTLPNLDPSVAYAIGVAPDAGGFNSMLGASFDPVMQAGISDKSGQGAVPELTKMPGSSQLEPVQTQDPDYSVQALLANKQLMTLVAIGAVVYILSK